MLLLHATPGQSSCCLLLQLLQSSGFWYATLCGLLCAELQPLMWEESAKHRVYLFVLCRVSTLTI